MHLVIGMTVDIRLISVQFWQALESWCSNDDIILAIQSHFIPTDIPLSSCKYTHLTLDTKEIYIQEIVSPRFPKRVITNEV